MKVEFCSGIGNKVLVVSIPYRFNERIFGSKTGVHKSVSIPYRFNERLAGITFSIT